MTNDSQRNRHPCDIEKNLEDVTLIWYDPNMDDSSDSQCTQRMLRETNQFYTELQPCLDFIRSIVYEKIFLVISGTYEERIMVQIYALPAVNFIFLLCTDRQDYKFISIPAQYQNIVQICTDKQILMKLIRSKIDQTTKKIMEFSLFNEQKQKSTRNLSQESASFLGFQILFAILKKIPRNDQALHDMLDKCSDYYQSNDIELQKIEQFRMTYTMGKVIEWYTRDSFVYRLVNKVLRTEGNKLLYLFRFYIVDLCLQLKQEHKKFLASKLLTLYRGQKMPRDKLEKLKQSVGISISPNGFFSTSRHLTVALSFITDYHDTDLKKVVLFEITVDPRLKSVIFADIEAYSRM